MATVNYLIKNKDKKKSSIYIFLSLGRGKQFETPTGFFIDGKDWSLKNKDAKTRLFGLPKNIKYASIKKITSDLKVLELFIHHSVNSSRADDTVFSKDWLSSQVDKCFNRSTDAIVDDAKKKLEGNKLTTHIQFFIDNGNTKVLRNGNIGLSSARIKSLKTFKVKIEQFEEYNKNLVYMKHIDAKLETKLKYWLFNIKEYSPNYSGKIIDNLKAICVDAERLGKEVNPYVALIKRFRQNKNDKIIIPISLDELKVIENKDFGSKRLNNVRDWLVLGCFIGQRGEDLLDITLKNIKNDRGVKSIQLTQQKTSKTVRIPILPSVERILSRGLPYRIELQKLNLYVKELCNLAGMTDLMEGDLMNPETNRKGRGVYPKYKLIASHSFRRSFCTNFYKKMPTPIIMSITGHSDESLFLSYICEEKDLNQNVIDFMKYFQVMEQEDQTPVIKLKTAN